MPVKVMVHLVGSRIAVEIQIRDSCRIVTGNIVSGPIDGPDNELRIELDEPQKNQSPTVLIVSNLQLNQLQADIKFGCDFYMRLDKLSNLVQ
jgi:hypothetical protein